MPPQRAHKPFPEKLAFLLNNPLRRILHPPRELVSKLDIKPSDAVVDFGCGPGFYLLPFAKVARKTVGVDVSDTMLNKAAENVRKNNVTAEFLKSDGTKI